MKKIIALALAGFVSSMALAQSLPSQSGAVQAQRYAVPAAKASTGGHTASAKKSKSGKHAAKSTSSAKGSKHAKKTGKGKTKSAQVKAKGKVQAKSGHKVH
ncbi:MULTISPECIES: hypothetical protein [Roseateles]|uniref:Acid-shock protein n=1 Tax=Roseateles albus TaxID=2987525 RepID=A0ABT5KIH1_9BURK|nr:MULTISPECIES: hypothetical protein [Roseateles]MCV2358014.1 hypothetical protein [Paucibacter sp. TC2R-5]MDC8773665.1 hypothetical protein [Roseateles albus]